MGTAEALGSATGAIIAGVLVDRVPLRPLLNAQAAIYITAGVLAAALIARHRAGYSPESAVTGTL
jgi:predicted MFS family arabinose efflux permease